MSNLNFFWHDYETWGANPRLDRPAQFAGIRTDYELEIIEEPIVLYASPPLDMLPHPESCLITGVTPVDILEQNHLPEVEFIGEINRRMSYPNTCSVGFNSIRFDDEITRFALYRNLLDPYAREWKNGCSRWDIIDALRLARTLRPQGINWPSDNEGKPGMRLEHLTGANDIEHAGAHDALSDVRATIALARLLKSKQPKLFNYALKMRNKKFAASMLDPQENEMVLHISGKYENSMGNMAVITPLAPHPRINNQVIVYNLGEDPEFIADLSATEINRLIFAKTSELAEGERRIAVKTVHLNRSPIVAPLNTLSDEAQKDYNINIAECRENRRKLLSIPQIVSKFIDAFDLEPPPQHYNPDSALYDGFVSDADRGILNRIHAMSPEKITPAKYPFTDWRLPELVFRFKARNFAYALDKREKKKWRKFVQSNLNGGNDGILSLAEYNDTISSLQQSADSRTGKILAKLHDWGRKVAQ